MNLQDIKWLHAEISTRCNAWCPACTRNQNGYGITPGLVEQDMSQDQFESFVVDLPALTGIQFCGNYGDPIAHHDFFSITEFAVSRVNKIQIHTNGGLRSTQWWKQLAHLLKDMDHDVWFGIDGIGEVHEMYRQGTDFQKVIDNASAFIQAGGRATWQFIPYQHNEYQLMDCMRLSQYLGFAKFKLVPSYRETHTKVLHWRTGEHRFDLQPAKVYKQMFFQSNKDQVLEKDCMHLSMPSIYLAADGRVSPCCYFASYKSFESVQHLLNDLDIRQEISSTPDKICLYNCGSNHGTSK